MEDQRKDLLGLLQTLEYFFDGTLGMRKMDPIYFKLKENKKNGLLETIPHAEVTWINFKKELECLVTLGVADKENDS